MSRGDGERGFIPLNLAILTVSDSRSLEDDRSGSLLEQRARAAGHEVRFRLLLPDDRSRIAMQLREWALDPEIDAVITTGGTGLTGRDQTVEAHRDVYEKEIDAFGAVFAVVSMRTIGASAVQSRACAGVANGTYLFALPGSPGACRDAWNEILEPQLDHRSRPCNFVEIMPRLNEHRLGTKG